MSTHDGYGHDDYDEPVHDPAHDPGAPRGGGVTPLGAGVVGLLAGALLAGIALAVIGGNPFSDANEVVFRDIVVADISDDADSLCWSSEPGRRDAPQECAILALDPAAPTPEEGDRVTVGVVTLRTPEGDTQTQVVYATAQAADPAAEAEGPETGADTGADNGPDTDTGTDTDSDAEAPSGE